MMEQVLGWHGLQSRYVSATWDGIVGAVRRGHPVLLGNQPHFGGPYSGGCWLHRRRQSTGERSLRNRFAPGYGSNNGDGILYPWKRVTPRTALEVIGVYPPPTATPAPTFTSTPVPTDTGTPTASIYKHARTHGDRDPDRDHDPVEQTHWRDVFPTLRQSECIEICFGPALGHG